MKKSFLFLIFLTLLSNYAIAYKTSVICGRFNKEIKFEIQIFKPIKNYYNTFFLNPEKNNQLKIFSDSFYFETNLPFPSTFLIQITDTNKIYLAKSNLIILPGDSVHIDIDLSSVNANIFYSGSNYEGNKLNNEIDYYSFEKFKKIKKIIDEIYIYNAKFVDEIQNCSDELIIKFKPLLDNQKITRDFYNYIKKTYEIAINNFVVQKMLTNSRLRTYFSKKQTDSIVELLYKKTPIINVDLEGSTLFSLSYEMNYERYKIYKKMKLNVPEQLDSSRNFKIRGSSVTVENECSFFLLIDNKKRSEDLWAVFMLTMLNYTEPGTFNKEINQFKYIFPKSEWSKYLDLKTKELSYVNNTTYSLATPIEFIDSTKKSNSLKEILELMPPNKAVFIDIWASWCSPCVKAFTYNNKLDSFLLQNNIERLYISLDNVKADNSWKRLITKYFLGGYHIRANENLVSDLRSLLNIKTDDPILIPRYLLINKHHEVVLNDAASPISFNILSTQIKNLVL